MSPEPSTPARRISPPLANPLQTEMASWRTMPATAFAAAMSFSSTKPSMAESPALTAASMKLWNAMGTISARRLL